MYHISKIRGFSIVWFVCDLIQKYYRTIGIAVGAVLGFWIFGWWFLIPIALGESAVYITKNWLGSDKHEYENRWTELIVGIARVWFGWALWFLIWICNETANVSQEQTGEADIKPVRLTAFADPYPAEYHDS